MSVSVCPAGIADAPPDRVWEVLATPERFGEWSDAEFVSARPSGAMRPGQLIELSAQVFGRPWPVSIDIDAVDPDARWVELRAHLPFGVVNHERVALTEMDGGRTLVRFN